MLLATGPEFHARVHGGEPEFTCITRCFQTSVGDRLWILSSSASLHVLDYTLEGAAISVPPCFPLCQDYDMIVFFPAPRVSPSLEVASTMAPCCTEALIPGWSFTSSTACRTSSVSSRWHTRGLAPTEFEVMLRFLDSHTAPLALTGPDLDLEALFHLRLRWLRRAVPAHAVPWLFLQACVPWLAATLSLLEESILLPVPSWTPPISHRGSLAELVTQMTLLCPYQQDRLSRGLSVQCPQGPDWAETNLHHATSAAGGTKQRGDTFLTLRGKPIHLFSVMTGRLERSLTAFLSQVIAEEGDVLSLDARRELSKALSSVNSR